jgi:hypothetical protein
MMRNLILVTFLFTVLLSQSQVKTYNLPPKDNYKRAKITLKNSSKFECSKAEIYSDSITFVNTKTNEVIVIPLSDVKLISVKNIDGKIFALFGAATVAIPLMTLMAIASPSNLLFSLLSGTAIGGVIGGFGGRMLAFAFPLWDVYYLEDLPE